MAGSASMRRRPLVVRQLGAARHLAHAAALALRARAAAAAKPAGAVGLARLGGLGVVEVGVRALLVLGHRLTEELHLLGVRAVAEAVAAAALLDQIGDHLERVALIHQELLALRRVVHLARISRHQRVEVGVELARALPLLRPQDAPEALRLLAARREVRRHLDDHVRLGQID